MTTPRPESRTGSRPTVLHCGGRPVAGYVHRPLGPEARQAPRPYLHPVRTLAGTTVTERRAASRTHHPGVGVAADLSGRDLFDLDDHGTQQHVGWLLRGRDGFVEELAWEQRGRRLLRERRTVAVRELGAHHWALDFTTALTNTTGEVLTIGSPARNGRPGGGCDGRDGCGGIFWFPPAGPYPPEVFSAAARGAAAVHGTTADWIAMATGNWTLVFAGATAATRADPWCVRAGTHPGVGPALAWDGRLPLPAGETLTRRVVTAVADGRLDRGEAARLAERLTEKGAAV